MKEYLAIAKVKLCHFEQSKQFWNEDRVWVEDSCLQLAYGVESCLRYVEELSGLQYLYGHNLSALCNQVELQINGYAWFHELQNSIKYMTNWHNVIMYIEGLSINTRVVNEVSKILISMVNDLESFAPKTVDTILPEDRMQAILDRHETGLTVSDISVYLPSMCFNKEAGESMLVETVLFAVEAYKAK